MGEKKACFNEYLQQRKNEEKEEARQRCRRNPTCCPQHSGHGYFGVLEVLLVRTLISSHLLVLNTSVTRRWINYGYPKADLGCLSCSSSLECAIGDVLLLCRVRQARDAFLALLEENVERGLVRLSHAKELLGDDPRWRVGCTSHVISVCLAAGGACNGVFSPDTGAQLLSLGLSLTTFSCCLRSRPHNLTHEITFRSSLLAHTGNNIASHGPAVQQQSGPS